MLGSCPQKHSVSGQVLKIDQKLQLEQSELQRELQKPSWMVYRKRVHLEAIDLLPQKDLGQAFVVGKMTDH